MGEVWRGVDDVLGREVAVKVLRREYAATRLPGPLPGRGPATADPLAHHGIAAVYDFGEDGTAGSPFLVMELVPGEPLSRCCAARAG